MQKLPRQTKRLLTNKFSKLLLPLQPNKIDKPMLSSSLLPIRHSRRASSKKMVKPS